MGTTKSRWKNGILEFYDSATAETIRAMAPLWFCDDFLGYQLNDYVVAEQTGAIWLAKDTSGGAEALLADGPSGILRLALTADNEKQEAGLYWGDERPLVLNQGLNIEFRAALHTLPTGQAEIYFGLAGDYVEGPIAEADAGPAEHIFFAFDGSGACKLFTDDATTDTDATATGITVLADAYHIYRIDCTTITDIKFCIDGARVGAATTHAVGATAALALQPFIMVHKETGTGVGELYVDYVKIWQKRS
jgi:hypothetical protein